MSNPFETIDAELKAIKSILLDLKTSGIIPALPEIERPLTVKEMCGFLGVTEATIIRWRAKGKIPYMKLGSRVLFSKSAVIKALEQKKKG